MQRFICLLAGAVATAACGDNFAAIVCDTCTVSACDACAEDALCEATAAAPCSCPAGFAGDGTRAGDGCEDIDECADDADDCVAAVATCENTTGGFACSCVSGYTGDGTTGGTGCTAGSGEANECADGIDDCVAGAACADTPESFTCACAQGFTGDGSAAGTGCTDIDECTASTDDCGSLDCANSMGSFSCAGWITPERNESFLDRRSASFVLLDRVPVRLDGGAISRVVSMAQDPTTGTVYVIVQMGVRRLATIEPSTGVATQVGSLEYQFTSLAFDATGQLWGVTGASGTTPRTLYRIDKTDGTRTLGRTLNLTSGACIAHHPTENALYHWAGGSAVKIDITAPGLDITAIPTTGPLPNELTSCVFDPARDAFLISDHSANIRTMTASGLYGATLSFTGRTLRGTLYLTTPGHAVFPAVGPIGGGTPITLTGLGLDQHGPTPTVSVGGVAATDVVAVDSTTITAVTPAGAVAGPVDVVLTGVGLPFNWPGGFSYE